ncbi:hypothetical protein T4A_7229 [Trichinella pseudospiralis]|uniref:Uncharacterized protein n=1 Tax=Trichinella pseudospiralis TaxID=6337 RepID=A0A0V1J2Q1_TRIPS|nr:hypothetical protein T4A_7229 [Trichinella pseudospiralis]KRZ29265.1 hypothetical protein T4C_5847 [Trichinella pseudospiralis]
MYHPCPRFSCCQQSNVIGGREDQDVLCDALCVNKNAFPDFVLVQEQDPGDLWEVLESDLPVVYTLHS